MSRCIRSFASSAAARNTKYNYGGFPSNALSERSNQEQGLAALGKMKDMAEEQADSRRRMGKDRPGNSARPVWKPFRQTGFLKPFDLTHKSRSRPDSFYRRRPLPLGPSRAVSEKNDPFHQTGIDPLAFALNPSVLSNFTSELGKIQPRSVNQITIRSQRRVAKAIKRAKMMGVIPILSQPRGSLWKVSR